MSEAKNIQSILYGWHKESPSLIKHNPASGSYAVYDDKLSSDFPVGVSGDDKFIWQSLGFYALTLLALETEYVPWLEYVATQKGCFGAVLAEQYLAGRCESAPPGKSDFRQELSKILTRAGYSTGGKIRVEDKSDEA